MSRPAPLTARREALPTDPSWLFHGERSVPSTRAQQEIFSASLSDPVASLGYNHSISIFLEGRLDVDALYSALVNLLARHEALRGRFSADGESFCVRGRIGFEMPVVDLRSRPPAARVAAYETFIRQELDHQFDLLEGPLFRATLVRRTDADSVLVFNCHHAVVDGWSLKIILAELPQLYSELVRGQATTDLAPAASFLEYVGFARAREAEHAERVRAYWREVYRDGVPALDLPLDNPRPADRTYAARREDYTVAREVQESLKAVGAARGASQFVTLLSAFALYLSRVSGQTDFVIGVPAAGQLMTGSGGLLGHDARLMPIRCQVDPTKPFGDLLQRMMDSFLASYEHQWITVPELVAALSLDVEVTRPPLTPVMFNFDPGLSDDALSFEGLKAHHFFNHRNAETFEISINAVIEYGELILECAYNRTLFDADAMHERLQQIECLMSSIVATPDAPVGRLPLVPGAQIAAMDALLNAQTAEFERDSCVDALVERHCLESPERIAVEFNDETRTYAELWRRSTAVAQALAERDLGSPPLVGVMVERSADLPALLLGVWRAGAAYVPLDPAYPKDRLEYMVSHSGMKILLADRPVDLALPAGLEVLDIGRIPAAAEASFQAPARVPTDLAYVIYTSGSTGRPKGVQIEHRSLVNLLMMMRDRAPGVGPDCRLLAVTTLSFDIAEAELWIPLIKGATVVVADRATAMDGVALMKRLKSARIDVMQATPSTWRVLLAAGWEGDPALTAICGGEALPLDLAATLVPRVRELWNAYGPTEATVWSTFDRVSGDAVTIGKPLPNTQAYVLDGELAWVPRGSVGELWLGGVQIARGYLGRDDLTRERFLPNPFTGEGMMYRTGDVVKLRKDGRIDYIGRSDFQVKVRGYRIELGEVQLALSRVAGIRQCVVVVRDKSPGDPHLVAFYTRQDQTSPDAQSLRTGLRATLPEYMVPGWFVELDKLPLTDNGKIDVKSLPDPFGSASSATPDLVLLEAAISEHPRVAQATVLMPPATATNARPVAFVVTTDDEELLGVELRRSLVGRVPERLIPDLVVNRESLPHTKNHQVDRTRLADLRPGAAAGDALFDRPQTPTEQVMAAVWRQVLRVEHVGVNDNFFDLGGHSLLSIQMITRFHAETGVRLTPRFVVVETLRQLAARVAEQQAGGAA